MSTTTEIKLKRSITKLVFKWQNNNNNNNDVF